MPDFFCLGGFLLDYGHMFFKLGRNIRKPVFLSTQSVYMLYLLRVRGQAI